MPSYTLQELMSQATTRAGRRADLAQSTVSFLVNEAIMEVATHAPQALSETSYIISSYTGQSRVTLPDDMLEPLYVALVWSDSTASSTVSSRATLTRISPEEAIVLGPHPTGTPNAFAFYRDAIEVLPAFDSNYSIHIGYRALPGDISCLSCVPSIATPWRRAVLLKAEALVRHYVNDFAGEAAAENAYLSYVHALKTDEARRQSGSFRMHVRPIYSTEGGLPRRAHDPFRDDP